MATVMNGVYKCAICGNIVEVLHTGGGKLVCCGEAMAHFEANTVDAAKEKHVPVIEQTDKGFKVKVGDVPHPMEPTHYIEWIELSFNGRTKRVMLKAGDAPEAEFCGTTTADKVTVRAYCNLHGLWQSELSL
ncbi:MAG: desulfoferrodoxin [Deltaproteobacteria bacterium]|nr:desulfoferrodoxin [Deltaproteobacteria bacterium]